MIRTGTRRALLAGASCVCLLASGRSWADGASQGSGKSRNGQSDRVEEVVVTANKRKQNLNKVGMTVQVLSASQLAQQHITSIQDVAAATPGLVFAQSSTDTPILSLRGIGFNETTLGVYPAVSVYLDQVPLPFPVMTLHSAFDLTRIEVLKGPQGTLFGENSTGGAINYVAEQPTKQFTAGADLTYGNYNDINGNAFISGSITPQLRMRLSATGETSDGWQQSYTRPGDYNGATHYYALRWLTDWTPSDNIHVSLDVNGWHDTSQPEAPQLIAIRPQIPSEVHPNVLNYPFSPQNPTAADWSTGQYTPSSDRSFYQTALHVDVNLPGALKLTSITGYSHLTQALNAEEDGTSYQIANIGPSPGNLGSFYQELRLANSTSSRFRWVGGANYELDNAYENQTLSFGDDSNSNPGTLFIDTTGTDFKSNITNAAVFGNAEYDVLPNLTLHGGLRFTQSDNHTSICGTSNGDGRVGQLFNVLGGLLGTVPFTPIGLGGCYPLNANNVPGQVFRSNLDENNLSWRGGVDYRITPNILLYADASRGYKAGSYPVLAGSTLAEDAPVKQESVTAFEGGIKASLLNHRLQLDGAGFYYNYDDKQIRGKLVDPIFNILDVLVNVPRSRIFGAEAEATYIPIDGLTFRGNITYLNAQVQSYTGPTVYGQTQNFAGTTLPFTPTWSGSVSGDYRFLLANGGQPFANITLHGQTTTTSVLGGYDIGVVTGPDYRSLPGLTKPFVLPGYLPIDAQLGYNFPDGRWSVMVWGKNIFNRYYFTDAAQFLDATVRFPAYPATYGITFSYRY